MTVLGRLVPTDWEHVEKYPLSALAREEQPKRVPVVLGINWYDSFDSPVKDKQGKFFLPGPSHLGSIRGGHCVCLEPEDKHDASKGHWWDFYDQGQEGACVGFGSSRMMSLLNRVRYDAPWLYHQAQAIDGEPLPHDGTYVRSACEILRTKGHVQVLHGKDQPQDAMAGISAYRWATTAGQVLDALGTPGADYVTVLNSWGRAYPQRVYMPVETLDLLLGQAGEAAIVTDR